MAKRINFNAGRVQAMYKAGKNVSQIAQAMGYAKGKGNNRVRNVLISAGVYQPTTTTRTTTKKAIAARPQRRAPRMDTKTLTEPNTVLAVCLRTIDVNVAKLKLDDQQQGVFARTLMGMIATNYGVADFHVRRPVLVLDEGKARQHVLQVANA